MSQVQVDELLAAAKNVLATVRYCWLLTEAEAGGANARPMGRLLPHADDEDWTMRFVTGGLSRKAFEMRRVGKVGLTFQRGDDAFLMMSGTAMLIEGASGMHQLWKDDYNVYFPSEKGRANAAFVEVEVERMELWIRGVTPEPFGMQATILERKDDSIWRLRAA